jgi:hypothetical protein
VERSRRLKRMNGGGRIDDSKMRGGCIEQDESRIYPYPGLWTPIEVDIGCDLNHMRVFTCKGRSMSPPHSMKRQSISHISAAVITTNTQLYIPFFEISWACAPVMRTPP